MTNHISSFGDTVLALTKCGQVFAWGNNEYGQIWPVDEIQVASPTLLPVHDAYQIPEECRLEDRCGSNEFRPGRISSVAAAGSMCGLLDEFGQVRCR
ncbi:unnamed protein product [Protopolystoma xenopodis]|uniref:Uncharacterized protein n=1 Tax=Protopolystoma xenopodis TaxID=117903 RepID=A0A3S5CFK4_9PLAT|nr:unnamed protein product [Protopolystoma xenopodis]